MYKYKQYLPKASSYSNNSHQYLSKGEKLLTQFMARNKIHYIYEKMTYIVDRGKLRLWYPDFTLPEHKLILEYAGITNDASYARSINHKELVYRQNNINAIFVYPNDFKNPTWPKELYNRISQYPARSQAGYHGRSLPQRYR